MARVTDEEAMALVGELRQLGPIATQIARNIEMMRAMIEHDEAQQFDASDTEIVMSRAATLIEALLAERRKP